MKPRKIFFDARYIRADHHDGISRFSAGLFEALQRKADVVALISDTEQLKKLPPCKHEILSAPTSILELFVARKLNKLGAEIVFSPMQTMGSWGRKYRLILTLHDLIYYRHPAPPPSFSLPIRVLWRLYHLMYWPQRLLLNRADAVATVSNTTKSLIHVHRLTKRPVSVVYNAAEQPRQARLERLAPTSKKLLYMGSFMEYKNVETLVRGMNFMPDYELVLLSRIKPERRAELETLTTTGQVTFLDGVSESEYISQLDGAFALVTASKDEGFGIPLVEAMNRGTPVIVSEIEIFREIGGGAAKFFKADSAEDFVRSVRSLEAPGVWLQASQDSLIQSEKFSWDKSADSLLEMIHRI